MLQNTPISCRRCGVKVYGREFPLRKNDGSLVTECDWRCPQCGTYLKNGTIRILEPAPTKQ